MAIRNIVQEGDAVLTKKCRKVEKFDEKLWQLLDDLAETMHYGNGVGLASPQVGVLKRCCVIDTGEGLYEFVNPEIIETQDYYIEEIEGCLSFPGVYGLVTRPFIVKTRAQDRFGNFFEIEGEGLFAQAMCHEFDHLDGILFVERANRILTPEEMDKIRNEYAEEGTEE